LKRDLRDHRGKNQESDLGKNLPPGKWGGGEGGLRPEGKSVRLGWEAGRRVKSETRSGTSKWQFSSPTAQRLRGKRVKKERALKPVGEKESKSGRMLFAGDFQKGCS